MGAAYGTAKSGVGVASMGVMRPELVMKSIVPVVMAGVLGIYGLIIAVIISTGINPKAKSYYLFDGYAHLSSGLACGLAGLSAGMAIGIVGDAGVRWILSCFRSLTEIEVFFFLLYGYLLFKIVGFNWAEIIDVRFGLNPGKDFSWFIALLKLKRWCLCCLSTRNIIR